MKPRDTVGLQAWEYARMQQGDPIWAAIRIERPDVIMRLASENPDLDSDVFRDWLYRHYSAIAACHRGNID
jgi:hypothetical protein